MFLFYSMSTAKALVRREIPRASGDKQAPTSLFPAVIAKELFAVGFIAERFGAARTRCR